MTSEGHGRDREEEAKRRFWARVGRHEHHDCWQWLGKTNPEGYGRFWDGVRAWPAHRFAYELLIGPIPLGLVIDHLCRNHGCVNPAHMEAVTHRENILRGDGPTARHARKTHCKRGHPLTEDNVYVRKNGGRNCRTCRHEESVRRWQELKQQREADAA